MTNKDILLGFAARLEQLQLELDAFGKRDGVSLWASHEAGVLMSFCGSMITKLIKLGEKV